ncbi:hypothetical protein WJX82_004660 [Trebouxia sp. C0006]
MCKRICLTLLGIADINKGSHKRDCIKEHHGGRLRTKDNLGRSLKYTSVKKAFKNVDLRLKGEVVIKLCLQVYDITQEVLDPLDPKGVKWKHICASHTVL